jgi:hypothetical protein
MWGMATLAMEVSSASMKVARVTVMAMAHGLARGRHVWWKSAVAVAAAAATRGSSLMVLPPWGAGWCWEVLVSD